MATARRARRNRLRMLVAGGAIVAVLAGCAAAPASPPAVTVTRTTYLPAPPDPAPASATSPSSQSSSHVSSPPMTLFPATSAPPSTPAPHIGVSDERPAGTFTLALAGDINFADRTARLLSAGPSAALDAVAGQLRGADLTMVNLESAITTRGAPAPKQFHFRTPPEALDALAAAGVDVVTMANNHAVDYGDVGLADTLDAVARSPIPVVGIGENAAQAYAPHVTTVRGVRVAILAASQVQDWTLASHTATDTKPGIASAFSSRLVDAVTEAKRHADVVIVYLHWGTEFRQCPSGEQRDLADRLAAAGASAVVGTHAHVLQGAGWRDDGVYVAYGLGNYVWWRSFGNLQDDNGVLTLTFRGGRVTAAAFRPSRLDERGLPIVATGGQRQRIDTEWDRVRRCADLLAVPPR